MMFRMSEIHTHITPRGKMSASDLDASIRSTFGHAVEGDLKIDWNDAQTQASVDIEIRMVKSLGDMEALLRLLPEAVVDTDIDEEIRKRAA